MALVLHDSERDVAPPPLASELPQPPSFHVYSCLIAACFAEDRVCFPFNIEDACNQSSISGASDGSGLKRPRAPIPKSTDGGVGTISGLGIKPMYAAYVTANFITYVDPRITPSNATGRQTRGPGGAPKEMISFSLLSELQHAMSTGSDSKLAAGRATAQAVGPHESQPSRRFAATLLLPRSITGKTASNKKDVAFLDAFALISAATDRPCFSVDAQGNPSATARNPPKAAPRKLTDTVRLSVVAGASAVAAFATGIGLSSNELFSGDGWKRSAIVCFSYLSGRNVVHVPCPLDDAVGVSNSPSRCVRALQCAALRAQVMSKGELVLPQGFLSTDYVAIDDDSPDESPFLTLQAEHQLSFRRLHLNETSVDVPPETLQKLNIGSGARARFVRICSKNSTVNGLRDESHCPGVLFSSNEELMVEYLNRNRLATPPNQWTREWPPYGVGAPVDEERGGCVSVLWWRMETKSVGSSLNLFFPRTLMGEKVTEVEGCRIFSVVPTLCPVENVFYAQNFILPCSAKSMIPVGPLASKLYQAFATALDEGCEFLFNSVNCPLPLSDQGYTSVLDGMEVSNPQSDDDDSFIAALMGLRLGHPSNTCGDVYTALQNSATVHMLASKSFCNLVATGVSKLGADVSIQEVMDMAACALEEKMSIPVGLDAACSDFESDKKRIRTPTGRAPSPVISVGHPPPRITKSLRQDSHASGLSDASTIHNPLLAASDVAGVPFDCLRPHWNSPTETKRMLLIAGLGTIRLDDFGSQPIVKFPMSVDALEDLLEIMWIAHGIGYSVYEEKSSKSKDGKMLAQRVRLPQHNDVNNTHRRLFEDEFAFAYTTYHDTMSEHGHDIVGDIETFVLFETHGCDEKTLYSMVKNTDGNLALKETATEVLLRPLKKMTRVMFAVTEYHTNQERTTGGPILPLVTQLNVSRSVPGHV